MVTFLYYLNYVLRKHLKMTNDKMAYCNVFFEKVIAWYYRLTPGGKVIPKKRKRELIVSLTTIPRRIDTVWIVVESILRQSYKPDKVILWLAEDEFAGVKLPRRLLKQQEKGLTVRYCKNLRSYKKFYYTMLENPDAYVVTVDDDTIYAENMLKVMVKTYVENPKCVICNRSHIIKMKNGKTAPYKQWLHYENRWVNGEMQEPSHAYFFTGCGGVLFPAWVLDRRLFDKDAFMKIAPMADDVWLNFICWVSGIKVKNTKGILGFIVAIETKSRSGLAAQNVGEHGNDSQILNVINYLGIDVNDYI